MTANKSWLHDYKSLATPIPIRLGDNHYINAHGFGLVITSNERINNVHFVRNIGSNLSSFAQTTDNDIQIVTNKQHMLFQKDGKEIARGVRTGNVYTVHFDVQLAQPQTACAATLEEWHQRFGHIAGANIRQMMKTNAVSGLVVNETPHSCQDCALNKCTKTSHPTRSTLKVQQAGRVLHLDTACPINTIEIDGSHFVLVCKDEFSNFRLVSPLTPKSQIADESMAFITRAELETENRVLQICTDNGSEFTCERLQSFLREKGILHHFSASYTPQRNGKIEREIGTLFETARTLVN